MNRPGVISNAAIKAEMSKANIEKALDAILETIIEATASGDKVKLLGFGMFELVERKQKLGRNPKTSEEILIPEHKAIKFKVGKTFKESIC